MNDKEGKARLKKDLTIKTKYKETEKRIVFVYVFDKGARGNEGQCRVLSNL